MLEGNTQIKCFREKSTVPKYLLQSALFSASKSTQKKNEEKLIKTFEDKELITHCEGFSQFDLAVSLAYKKVINQHKNFENIIFSISDFSKALNRKEGGKTRKIILDAFKKSNQFHLSFDFKNGCFDGYRLNSFDEIRANEFRIAFNLEYLNMVYDESETCDIDIDTFLNLKLGLQSWLYGFICSVPKLTEIDMDSLHSLSGSNYRNRNDFKKSIKEALNVLHAHNIIEWRHGVDRRGLVFWEYKNPFGD